MDYQKTFFENLSFFKTHPFFHTKSGSFTLDSLCAIISQAQKEPIDTRWAAAALQRSFHQLNLELPNFDEGQKGVTKMSHFRTTLMRAEPYLTADQLEVLMLMADKDADGGIMYREFLERSQKDLWFFPSYFEDY